MNYKQTLKNISLAKNVFSASLMKSLNLTKVEAPLIVSAKSGLNDDLNGVEEPVSIGTDCQVVQSLAKWKRYALNKYGFNNWEGILTDMRAIRPDETLGPMHSMYVDQFDWEKVITNSDRNTQYLHNTVESIYSSLQYTEQRLFDILGIEPVLPKGIVFTNSELLEYQFPYMTPRERENKMCERFGAVFVQGIGAQLKSGQAHDGRAPDYDDWSLNGDILVWNPVLNRAFELSSMGIRVNKESLKRQLDIRGIKSPSAFHNSIMNDELPLTIGGGIGQSRLCMFLLRKHHIGEVQVSVWDNDSDVEELL